MCAKCDYLKGRRSIRELVYAEGQQINQYDEALIDSMMAMLKLRNTGWKQSTSEAPTVPSRSTRIPGRSLDMTITTLNQAPIIESFESMLLNG